MKTSFPSRRRRVRGAAPAALSVLVLVGVAGGITSCGRSGGGTGEAPAAGASAAAQEETGRLLSELTQQVRKYSVEQRQPPASLDDLVARGYLKELPAAPAGKRFVITKNLQVELANR